MYCVSYCNPYKGFIESETFLTDKHIQTYIDGLKAKDYVEIKVSEYDVINGENCSIKKVYDPLFGDDRICICGNPYGAHFDADNNMDFCGCKEDGCETFIIRRNKKKVRFRLS